LRHFSGRERFSFSADFRFPQIPFRVRSHRVFDTLQTTPFWSPFLECPFSKYDAFILLNNRVSVLPIRPDIVTPQFEPLTALHYREVRPVRILFFLPPNTAPSSAVYEFLNWVFLPHSIVLLPGPLETTPTACHLSPLSFSTFLFFIEDFFFAALDLSFGLETYSAKGDPLFCFPLHFPSPLLIPLGARFEQWACRKTPTSIHPPL